MICNFPKTCILEKPNTTNIREKSRRFLLENLHTIYLTFYHFSCLFFWAAVAFLPRAVVRNTKVFRSLLLSLSTSVGFGRWRWREWGREGRKEPEPRGMKKERKRNEKKKRKQLFLLRPHSSRFFFRAVQKKGVAVLSFPSLSFSRRAEAEKKV